MAYIGYTLKGEGIKDFQSAQTLDSKPLSDFVQIQGAETVAGVKIFTASPIIDNDQGLSLAVGAGTAGDPLQGMFRWVTSGLEGYDGTAWVSYSDYRDFAPVLASVNNVSNIQNSCLDQNAWWSSYHDWLLSGYEVTVNSNLLDGIGWNNYVDLVSTSPWIQGVKTFKDIPVFAAGKPVRIPAGVQTSRPDPERGGFRFNTDLNSLEGFALDINDQSFSWSTLLDSSNFSNVNLLYNSNLRVFARPSKYNVVLGPNVSDYGPDRWVYWVSTGHTIKFFNLRWTPDSNEPDFSGYYNRITVTGTQTGPGQGCHISQTIPAFSANNCLSKTFTVSFKGRVITGEPSLTFGLGFYRGFGIPVNENKWFFPPNSLKQIRLDGEIKKYSLTFTVPQSALQGITLYPENCLAFYMSLAPLAQTGVNSTKEVDLADFVIEESPYASRYVISKSVVEERAECRHFYYIPPTDFVHNLYQEYAGERGYFVNWFFGTMLRNSQRYSSNINWAAGYNTTRDTFYPSLDGGVVYYKMYIVGHGECRITASGTYFDRDLEPI